MIWKRKPGKKRWLLVILIAIPMVWTIGSGFAEEPPKILMVNPVPNIPQPESPELPPGVREGIIERVAKDFIVISDVAFRLAPKVRYLSEYNGPEEAPSEFKVGTHIRFRIDDQRELTEMWLFK